MLKFCYYNFFKPYIPRRLQILIRRAFINWKLPAYSHVWPIDPNSAKPPGGWAGWPDGKKFALVLTHDVDTQRGHDKCNQLADIEERLGFRSSFNFVAEDYQVSSTLLNDLTNRGFEIGQHGIHHTNPFKTKMRFREQAVKINRYLKEWNSVGFRGPSMFHNLEWVHDLNIEYDSSTFDTDPFEPQPDGVGTIFPFWVPGDQNGYVELPYTLPQDFLPFILMQKKDIDIWKKKLDWIVDNGGMALFIAHPDYMNFKNNELSCDEYPPKYYEEFLTYIKTKYKDKYWHVLPKDMARFWSARTPDKDEKIKKIRACMLAYTFYESDGRVRRYAEALAQRGDHVDVIALQREGQPSYEILNGVHVFRIQEREIDEKGKLDYLYRVLKFFINSTIFLTKKNKEARYDVIHVHSVPDFLVFASCLSKLGGAKIILDIHDILPEFYASKFNKSNKSSVFKALLSIEKASCKFADHVIAANHIWEKTLTDRSVEKEKCTTLLNYPDTSIFHRLSRRNENGKFIILYPGTLNQHQGLDIAIKAFSLIKDQCPAAEFHIYGEGPSEASLKKLVSDLCLKDRIIFKGLVSIEEIAQIMASADLGVIPKRNDFFGGEAFSTKILEFMILGVPVVASATKIDKYYFNDSIVKFFTPDDESDLAKALISLIKNKELRDEFTKNALSFVDDYTWDKRQHEYLDLVDSLIRNDHSS